MDLQRQPLPSSFGVLFSWAMTTYDMHVRHEIA